MSAERDEYLRAWAERARLERRASIRPVLIHGKNADNATDITQLRENDALYLRDPDTGEAFFTLDYSALDGPDVLAP